MTKACEPAHGHPLQRQHGFFTELLLSKIVTILSLKVEHPFARHETMVGRVALGASLVLIAVVAGCGILDRDGDEDPSMGEWIEYRPEDAFCGNGDPYAVYVQFSESASEDLIIFFESGGTCWDYASCTPGGGARQPGNLEGLPEDYANMNQEIQIDSFSIRPNANVLYPLLNDDPAISPMANWNKVFVPYCTGDAHAGASTVTYRDPAGMQPDYEFRHVGHLNVLAMIEMLDGMFDRIDRLFVGGGSAGGIGAVVNYHFIRTGLNVEGQSYLFNDSGPIFPALASTSRTAQLYEIVREVWKLDDVIDSGLPSPEAIKADFGALNPALAETHPDDRFAAAFFQLDYNVPLYSYERFYQLDNGTISEFMFDGSLGLDENFATDRTAFYSLWWDDVALLRDQYDAVENLAYFIPYWRQTNESHLTTVTGAEESDPLELAPNLLQWLGGDSQDLELDPELVWVGTEITTEDGTLDVREYVDILLDDQAALPSYFEVDAEGPFVPCTPGEDSEPLMPIPVDPSACEAVASSN